MLYSLLGELDVRRGCEAEIEVEVGLFPEDDMVKLLQDVVTGKDLHQQFQLVLLPEVLEGALRELLSGRYLAFHLV